MTTLRTFTAAVLGALLLGPAVAAEPGTLSLWRQYGGVTWDATPGAARSADSTSAPIVGLRFDGEGRAFVSTPRLLSPKAQATISVLDLGADDKVARLTPFPSAEANDRAGAPATTLRSVLGFHIDRRNGWLWAIDAGFVGGESKAPAGAQKLMVFDMVTRKLVKSIPLDAVADRKGSFLNDIAVDEARQIAYVSDSGYRSAPRNLAGIIVVELKKGKARRVLHQHPAVMPEPGRKVFAHGAEVFPNNPLLVGINGIALSPDARTLYWTVTAGSKLHAMSTAELRKGKTGKVRDLGAVGGNTDGIVVAADGAVYITDVSRNGIVRYDPASASMKLVAADERIYWPDTASLGPDNAVYFTANNLNNHFAGAVADGQERYSIWKLPLPSILTGGSRASR
jgi:sugar lactone lactonase YvrE